MATASDSTAEKSARWGVRLVPALAFALLLLAARVCYWPGMHGSPVWDDAAHLTRPDLQSWTGLARIWTDVHATQQYYPVLHSAFWFEHRLWGDATFGYHLINVVFHATNAWLLALVLRRLWRPPTSVLNRAETCAPNTPEPNHRHRKEPQPHDRLGALRPPKRATRRSIWNFRGSAAAAAPAVALSDGRALIPVGTEWLAALLFVVHPVAAESVAWISEQKNTLSLLFYLLAALTYFRFERSRRSATYALATLWFLLALGTKSVTATLPAALLVLAWWRRGRASWREDVRPLLPWFALGIGAGAFTAWIEQTLIGAHGAPFDVSWWQRLLLAARNIWFYLGKLAWPSPLMFIYPRWHVATAFAGWSFALLAALGGTFTLWRYRQSSRGPLAAWLLFVGGLFPALGFFNVYPFVFSFVADHFQYHASVAWFAAVAAGVALAAARCPRAGRIVIGMAVIALVTSWGAITRQQSATFRDSETLYRATLARNPDCWMAHSNLAIELTHSPATLPEALDHFAAAIRLKPDCAEAFNNWGNALATQLGRREDAVPLFERALRIEPRFGEARLNLANTLADMPGHLERSLLEYRETLRQHPDYPEAHFCLANTLSRLPDRRDEAMQHYRTALQLRPDYLEAHANLAALALTPPADLRLACAHLQRVIELTPNRPQAHYSYALALARDPSARAAAIAEYRTALALDPASVAAHNNLGVLYAQAHDYAAARAEWEAALKLQPDDPDVARNLQRLDQLAGRH